MDDIHSVLLNLLSNVVWVPVGMVTAWLAYFLGIRLPHRRLWRLSDPSKLTICASNSTNTNTGVYSRPSTGIGQVRAMALAINSLNAAYHKQLDVRHILLSTDHIQDRMENDLLILGGPKTNRVAAELFKAIENEQPALQVKNVIYWRVKQRNGEWVSYQVKTGALSRMVDMQTIQAGEASYIIEEQSLVAKTGHAENNEDFIHISPSFVAVIDGTTSKTVRLWDGKTGGQVCAHIIDRVLSQLPGEATAEEAVGAITTTIKDFYFGFDNHPGFPTFYMS